jgi:hypothetical protein
MKEWYTKHGHRPTFLDPLTPTLSRREREKRGCLSRREGEKRVPLPEGEGI